MPLTHFQPLSMLVVQKDGWNIGTGMNKTTWLLKSIRSPYFLAGETIKVFKRGGGVCLMKN